LYARLTEVMSGMATSYELIFVNDGSRDETLRVLKSLRCQDAKVKILNLTRNFGHQAAVTAGLDHATGRAIVVMDSDLQDPPELIPSLMTHWEQGYDVVYAVRKRRKEHLLKRASYWIFYRLLKMVSDIEIPLDVGDFALIDSKVASVLRQMPEKNRFVRGLRSWVGFRQIGVEYERSMRFQGQSKYGLARLFHLASSGFMSFSKLPLRLATYLGMLVSLISFLLGIGAVLLRLIVGVKPQGWTSLIVVVLFLGGAHLITLGILGEYLGYVLDEVRRRPTYIVSEWLSADPKQETEENIISNDGRNLACLADINSSASADH
jgi:glycosyltransferase involved in cell wall biosynthesis